MSYYIAVFEGGPYHGKIIMIQGMPAYYQFARMQPISLKQYSDTNYKPPDPITISYRLSHVNYANKKAFQADNPMELVYRFGEVGEN